MPETEHKTGNDAWIRKPQGNTCVVFVHGILSSGEECWRNGNGTCWPDLLKNEADLASLGIYSFTYQTGVFSGSYSISDAVDALWAQMGLDDVLQNNRLIFVCHSMGGIVVRKFLVERATELIEANKKIGLFLVASPSLGSKYADWFSPLARRLGHTQADALRLIQNNAWLKDLDKLFRNLKEGNKLKIRGKELVEDKFVVLKRFWLWRRVVEPLSAATYFGNSVKVPNSEHFSIAKPEGPGAFQHRLLRQFIQDAAAAFDRDATEAVPQAAAGIAPVAAAAELSRLHQLRPPPGDFTGREKELQELRKAAGQQGATICGAQGMAGVGKTALALKLAEELAPQFPDAQIFLDLKGVDTTGKGAQPLTVEEAMRHVIAAFHPEAKLPDSRAELEPLYRSTLHGQRALLLMDNARDAEQVQPLIPSKPCLMLVTSRARFTLPGLKRVELPALLRADSVKLLLEIESRIGNHADAIATLCGDLPLALRATASALRENPGLHVEEYVVRLEQGRGRLKLKPGGEAVVDASLQASFDLLPADQQRLFCALAIFPDTFLADAAAAVWDMDAVAASEILNELRRYSLLEWDPKTERYRLHDLVRLFAAGLLADDRRFLFALRHAQHYVKLLAAANSLFLKGGESIRLGLAIFDVERLHILAGQEWAAGNATGNDQIAQLCSVYAGAGPYVLGLRLHALEQIHWLEAAIGAARQLGDKSALGLHSGNLGLAYADLGETRKAIEFHEQSLAIAREIGDRHSQGTTLGNLGLAYAALGETRKAIEFFEQSLAIARAIGDRRGEGVALGNLGRAYADLGETRKAIEFYEQSLPIARAIGDRRGEGATLGNLGLAYADLGEPRKAIEFHEESLAIAREIGDRQGEGIARGNLGTPYADLGETRKAIEFYEQSLAIAREIGDRRGEAISLFNASQEMHKLGQTEEAIAWAKEALRIYTEIESPDAEDARRQLQEWGAG